MHQFTLRLYNQKHFPLEGREPLVDYSFDYDDYDGRDFYDERRDERREQDRIDDMRRNDAMEAFLRDAEADMARQAMQEVVNNPKIKVDTAMMKAINDPSKVMMPNGRVVSRRSGQFDRSNILPNLAPVPKRTRKKTKCDKNMSKALVLANKKFRKKNGKLRKGVTQSRIMKYAHKLCKKM